MHPAVPEESERAGKKLLDAAFRVHTLLGPGLLESVYEKCLCQELRNRHVPFKNQAALAIVYDGQPIDAELRLDLLVENCVVAELKTIEVLTPLHQAQLISYLKLSNRRLGYLINFNVQHLKDGIRRIVV